MDCSKMSDQEINRLVARQFPETYLFNEEGNPYQLIPDSMAAYSGSDFDEVEFQPCGNPSDAWPIIVEHGIGIIPYKKGLSESWNVSTGLINGTTKDVNPLRAAMIVFLMMQDSANVQDNPA